MTCDPLSFAFLFAKEINLSKALLFGSSYFIFMRGKSEFIL